MRNPVPDERQPGPEGARRKPGGGPRAAPGTPTRAPRGGLGGAVLRPGRLDRLVQTVARLYRKAHLTADEVRYVHQRIRQRLGLRGRPERAKRLPEILTPEELRRVLAQAYREHPRNGLVVRTLFETGLRVSDLVRPEVTDVDFLERTIAVREGKGGK